MSVIAAMVADLTHLNMQKGRFSAGRRPWYFFGRQKDHTLNIETKKAFYRRGRGGTQGISGILP
jgi:hypothetical protein